MTLKIYQVDDFTSHLFGGNFFPSHNNLSFDYSNYNSKSVNDVSITFVKGLKI
jgi:hypothetical protein